MSEEHWEEAHCPICAAGTDSAPHLSCADRLREPLFRNYRLRRCAGCGLIFLSPRPAGRDAGEFHPQEGYDPFLSLRPNPRLADRAYLLARRLTLAWKRRLIRTLMPEDSRILDIGCGTGEFLKALHGYYAVTGLEPEPNAAKWARDQFGLAVFDGDLNSLPTDIGQFDLVTMWHVLEHLPDPLSALGRIHNLLRPGGRLLIALPNICSLDARIYGANWIALDAPRHLWHFTPRTLSRLAAGAGFALRRGGMLPLDAGYNILGSERIMAVRAPAAMVVAPLRVVVAGIGSLLWGAASGNHSGQFYVFSLSE